MGLLQNETETLDPAESGTQWEATPQLSAAAVDAVVVLGVLTFALQLCLVLYFLFRCWRLDLKVQEALKQNPQKPPVIGQLVHLNLGATIKRPHCESSLSITAKSSESHNFYHESMDGKYSYTAPSIPWDLVQR